LLNANGFSKFFHRRLVSKFLVKQQLNILLRYISSTFCAQKSPWAKRSELPCQPFETDAEKFSSSDIASFSLLTKRYLEWPHRKTTEWPTVLTCSNQEERHRDKAHVHMITGLILVDDEVKMNEACCRNMIS